MKNKINIAEILKDCPSGMELDCTMYEGVTLKYVSVYKDEDYPICIETQTGFETKLTKYGQNVNLDEAKFVIFPKGKTTWEGFVPPCKFKDGDILFVESVYPFIVIYKENENEECFYKYVAIKDYPDCTHIFDGNEPLCHKKGVSKIRFATEEEKKKLFNVIKENGYRWNADTKTLEKIVEPKFNVGDRVKHKLTGEIYRIMFVLPHDGGTYEVAITNEIGKSISINEQDNWELVIVLIKLLIMS